VQREDSTGRTAGSRIGSRQPIRRRSWTRLWCGPRRAAERTYSPDWFAPGRAWTRLDADPYRGTPLIWAAVRNRTETAEWLIHHGAPVNQKATFGGLTHGQGVTALHMASQCGHLSMVQLLIQREADPKIKDDLYHGDAAAAADYFGQTAVRDYLRSLGNYAASRIMPCALLVMRVFAGGSLVLGSAGIGIIRDSPETPAGRPSAGTGPA